MFFLPLNGTNLLLKRMNHGKMQVQQRQQTRVYLELVIVKTMRRKGKILAAMSSGIDSIITAVMLHDEGHKVVR